MFLLRRGFPIRGRGCVPGPLVVWHERSDEESLCVCVRVCIAYLFACMMFFESTFCLLGHLHLHNTVMAPVLPHVRMGFRPILSLPLDGHISALCACIHAAIRGAYMNIFHKRALNSTMSIQDSSNSGKY